MDDPNSLGATKIRQASALIRASQKKQARQILREVLIVDNNNLSAWELLTLATYNPEELVYCLKRILILQPHHPWANDQLDQVLSATPNTDNFKQESKSFQDSTINLGSLSGFSDPYAEAPLPSFPSPESSSTATRPPNKRPKKIPAILYIFGPLGVVCLVLWGYILLFTKNPPLDLSRQITQTADVLQQANCQVLIDQAMQAAGTSCDQVGANSVCYGNFTLKAELVPGRVDQFSGRGDKINIQELVRLSASPLNINTNQWGIAIFKVMANLPRSLPGETVTLMVFGNTTLDNQSPTLETFYFSSQLGQVVCDKVPFDGIVINTPEGSGVKFKINGTELTLMGDASLKANPGGSMEVSLYSGSGLIVSNGQEQYFGAGQKISVALGGENGMQAISVPSAPEPLSPAELNIACTMFGQFCGAAEITPVSVEQARSSIQSGLGITPTPSQMWTSTRIPTTTATRTPIASHAPVPSRTSPAAIRTPIASYTPVPSSTSPAAISTPTIKNTHKPPTNTPKGTGQAGIP
jgi:hypothetical protein